MKSDFTLDPQLAADTIPIGNLNLCQVQLMNDSRFPWLTLVPRRSGLAEIIDLAAADRAQLMDEMALTSAALKSLTGAQKLNVGALGNIVRQLHVHIVARFASDAAWPGPVWGFGQRIAYSTGETEDLIARLRPLLGTLRA